jgi:predicted CXXCH cytochrome family protein
VNNDTEVKKQSISFFSQRRMIGFVSGIFFGVIFLMILMAPQNERLHVLGPMTIGHESFKCNTCHSEPTGTLRQQLQANVKYWLNLRSSPVDIGKHHVSNEVCLKCHNRPNERHPVYRFNEPRYAEARAAIAPQNCISCHNEHQGKRVTISSTNFCVNCHKETKIKNDPIDVPHDQLIAKNQWNTCMGCHDFHGNHEMVVSKKTSNQYNATLIQNYLDGKGSSPYSNKKLYDAKKENEQ